MQPPGGEGEGEGGEAGGSDTMWGDVGDDTAYGEGGNDTINGNVGDDALYGGKGTNTLNGGSGYDTVDPTGPLYNEPDFSNRYIDVVFDMQHIFDIVLDDTHCTLVPGEYDYCIGDERYVQVTLTGPGGLYMSKLLHVPGNAGIVGDWSSAAKFPLFDPHTDYSIEVTPSDGLHLESDTLFPYDFNSSGVTYGPDGTSSLDGGMVLSDYLQLDENHQPPPGWQQPPAQSPDVTAVNKWGPDENVESRYRVVVGTTLRVDTDENDDPAGDISEHGVLCADSTSYYAASALNCGWYEGTQILFAQLVEGEGQALGTATVNLNGSFTFVAHANAWGRDFFRIIVTDGQKISLKATVYVNIEKRRTILMIGYWPVTDTNGYPNRHGMLEPWKTLQANYQQSGFDVIAISAKFPAVRLGVFPNGTPNYGKGEGLFTVDYHNTSREFWRTVKQYHPVAIMSFSRGNNDQSWELEKGARNLAQAAWDTQPYGLAPPIPGGTANDFSPYRGISTGPKPGLPPDPTKTAGSTRDSTLPMEMIVNAINTAFPPGPAYVDTSYDVGAYVSEYIAYLVTWYRDVTWTLEHITDTCIFAGHTHVGANFPPGDGTMNVGAIKAVKIQLDVLIQALKNLGH